MAVLKAFLKDQLLDFMGYAYITILILFFYYLKFGNGIEVYYPILLSLFVTSLVTLAKGVRYFRFHKVLQTADYNDHLLHGASNQENEVIETLHMLQQHYHGEISTLVHQSEEANAFIAQMVHDMKIPISLIRLALDDIQGSDKSQLIDDENLEKIKSGSDKVLNKLSQLLCYLRLGRFEKDYSIERVNLVDEIRNAINEKKDYFILNHCYPRFDSKQAAVYILTDRKWHGMLLDQIISNAIKYSTAKEPEGYIHFQIRQEKDFVELAITDYGIGIPPYDMERIFEPFFTGENGRRIGNSSGVGLYLCRNICEKLGHQISITSVKGEKTEVKIRYLSKM
jgi:signal transduction histidine kinase